MKTIWKYVLSPAREQELLLPKGSKILSAGMQMDDVCIWVLCSDKALLTPRRVLVVGTGHPADDLHGHQFVGTVVAGYPTYLVWHIFVEPEKKEVL